MKTIESFDNLLGLPRKILHYHGVDGLAQMVLHELGHHGSFGITKATYLVDNPDFGCMRGVAGYQDDECVLHKPDLWHDPYAFVKDMQDAKFHREVARFSHTNLARNDADEVDEKAIRDVGNMLGMKNPSWALWPMQHGNSGVLLFEHNQAAAAAHHRKVFEQFVPLLSLC
ncbi:MAG: hypothetical protein WC365_05260 [Candidatus Babeliales bacterium]|jgi:hypothetical protein